MTEKYKFISDPGHGWLRVPLLEILALGIADEISTCSYLGFKGRHVYLEEDCDLSVFCRAKGWKVGTLYDHIEEEHQEFTQIRQMDPFNGRYFADHIEVVSA